MNAATAAQMQKALVVCDRGILDAKAYMSQSEFEMLLADLQTSEVELRDNYDAVFHLVSAAKGVIYHCQQQRSKRERRAGSTH